MNHQECLDVSAVIVTYNPNLETLKKTVLAITSQVSDIFIIDNASINFSIKWESIFESQCRSKLHLLPQPRNVGLGAAHNLGILKAKEINSSFVLLLDQDSQAAPEMVYKLRSAYFNLAKTGKTPAAMGPRYRDSENGTLSKFVKVGFLGFTLVEPNSLNPIVEIDFLVSSGALLPLYALNHVGHMDEDLFIDHIDTEWCFRAKSKGYHIYGVSDAEMVHTLGEHRKEIWLFRKRTIPFHNPFRYYYIFRNSVLLYRRSYMPWSWKISDFIRCLKILIFFGMFAPNRKACLKMMLNGSIDGYKKISGKQKNIN